MTKAWARFSLRSARNLGCQWSVTVETSFQTKEMTMLKRLGDPIVGVLLASVLVMSNVLPSFSQDPPQAAPQGASQRVPDPGFKIKQSFADYIRPIVGAGFVVRQDDYIDFKIEDDVLLTKDASLFRVGAIAGFFTPVSKCGVWWHKLAMARGEGTTEAQIAERFNEEALECDREYRFGKVQKDKDGNNLKNPDGTLKLKVSGNGKKFFMRSGIIYTLQFTQGSENTVDGFTFGWGFELKPGVLLTFGHTRNKGEQLSEGFQRAAADAISDTTQTQFARFRNLVNDDKTGLKSSKDWDGLPLKLTNGDKFFPGGAIIESYNSSWSFGVAVSLDAILK